MRRTLSPERILKPFKARAYRTERGLSAVAAGYLRRNDGFPVYLAKKLRVIYLARRDGRSSPDTRVAGQELAAARPGRWGFVAAAREVLALASDVLGAFDRRCGCQKIDRLSAPLDAWWQARDAIRPGNLYKLMGQTNGSRCAVPPRVQDWDASVLLMPLILRFMPGDPLLAARHESD